MSRPKKSDLDKLRASLRTKFKEVVLPSGDMERSPITSFGLPGIDYITGIGGIEAGRVYELAGGDSSGKTTLLLNFVKTCQQKKISCVYLDMEASVDMDYAQSLGVNSNPLFQCSS